MHGCCTGRNDMSAVRIHVSLNRVSFATDLVVLRTRLRLGAQPAMESGTNLVKGRLSESGSNTTN